MAPDLDDTASCCRFGVGVTASARPDFSVSAYEVDNSADSDHTCGKWVFGRGEQLTASGLTRLSPTAWEVPTGELHKLTLAMSLEPSRVQTRRNDKIWGLGTVGPGEIFAVPGIKVASIGEGGRSCVATGTKFKGNLRVLPIASLADDVDFVQSFPALHTAEEVQAREEMLKNINKSLIINTNKKQIAAFKQSNLTLDNEVDRLQGELATCQQKIEHLRVHDEIMSSVVGSTTVSAEWAGATVLPNRQQTIVDAVVSLLQREPLSNSAWSNVGPAFPAWMAMQVMEPATIVAQVTARLQDVWRKEQAGSEDDADASRP